MGQKAVLVSATLLTNMFTEGMQAACVGGLPRGARLVGARLIGPDGEDDPEGTRRVGFIFEHPDWPDTEQGDLLPVVDVELATLVSE